MSIPEDYFRQTVGNQEITLSTMGMSFKMSLARVGAGLDRAQAILDAQVWNDIRQYMPLDTGNLQQQTNTLNASVHGEVYFYDPSVPYGHYQYQGVVYEDPVYHRAGWYDAKRGQWWSRKGVKKVPSARKLKYKQPSAVDHWGQYAFNIHKQTWLKVAERAFYL